MGNRPLSISSPDAPSLCDARILLAWARYLVPHFAVLRNDVSREVGSYLGGYQHPIAVLQREVHFFDIKSSQWKLLFKLSSDVKTFSMSSATFIAPRRLFVCGGMERSVLSSSAMVLNNGAVRMLADMKKPRADPGVAYHSLKRSVYVFGGFNQSGNLQSGERCELPEGLWTDLPPMHTARSAFNPCLHQSFVYLCGGYCCSVETYDLNTNTFTECPQFQLPEEAASSLCTATVAADSLIVICATYTKSWHIPSQQCTATHPHAKLMCWSSSTPVHRDGTLFIINNFSTSRFVCTAVEVVSGKQLFQKELVITVG